jgi:hypothetical protein
VALYFDREESTEQKVSKLAGFVVQYGLPLAEAVPLLTALLSLPPAAGYAPLNLPPEQQKQKTLHALLTLLLRIAAQRSVLLIMEDLHWVDPTTLELLSLLVDQGPTARILALWTFRPDFTPLDRSLTPHPSDTAAPAASTGRGDDQPGGPRQGDASGDRGAGGGQDRWVPLFVEELIKMVLESGLLQEREERVVS